MSLVAIPRVRHITGAPAANTVEGWLNALFATLDGNMTHWDVGRYQLASVTQALYFTPKAGNALSKNLRIMVAGADGGSLTPTMGLNCTFANSKLFMSLTIGGGAFDAWDAAAPFTSHDYHSGLFPIGACASITLNVFHVFESAESIFILPVKADGTIAAGGEAGGLFDPESAHSANVSPTGDGRVYAVWTMGDASIRWNGLYTNWGSTAFSGLAAHGLGAADCKAVFLAPGGTWTAMRASQTWSSSFHDLRQADGSPWLMPLVWFHNTNNTVIGRQREAYHGPKVLNGTVILDDAGNTRGYAISYSGSTPDMCLCFAA